MGSDFLPLDFADPWEHVRLLSDRARNDVLLEMLARRAPGSRVVEIGCGTGLLACVAARLGAARVYAVEETALADRAEALVADNGLQDRVTVLRAKFETLPPTPVDLAFSELLNADPFYEGVLPAMRAATAWLAPGGTLSPRRVKVHVALAYADEAASEWEAASREVGRICAAHGLRPDAMVETLAVRHPQRVVTAMERPVSTVATAFDLPLHAETVPPDPVVVRVRSKVKGAIGGAMVWFEAEVDDGLWMANTPGAGSHWGQMVCGWSRARRVRAGEQVALQVRVVEQQVVVEPADA